MKTKAAGYTGGLCRFLTRASATRLNRRFQRGVFSRMKPFSKSFKAACCLASDGCDTPSEIRRFCTNLRETAALMPPVSALEAEVICYLVWNSELTLELKVHEAGVLLSELLRGHMSSAGLDPADSGHQALLCALATLDVKLRMLPPESTYLLFLSAYLMQFAPDGAKISDFLVIDNG